MDDSFPGPKTREALERGVPLFQNGLRFDSEMERAGRRGFRSVRQIVIDRAEGDFVWLVRGDNVERRSIVLGGPRDRPQVLVTRGLVAGDAVVRKADGPLGSGQSIKTN